MRLSDDTFEDILINSYEKLYSNWKKKKNCKIKISFIYTFYAITGTPGVTTTSVFALKSWGIATMGGGSSSFGSTTDTLSGNGFFGPFLPDGSQGNMIFTLIPKTPVTNIFDFNYY